MRQPYFLVKGERLVLRRDGTWESNGTEITHEPTHEAFSRNIHWDEEAGKYFISLGYERIHVEVEDTPYFITALEKSGTSEKSAWTARLSTQESLSITPEALEYRERALYLRLADGQHARFLSAPYYEILGDLQEDENGYFLTVGGKRVGLAPKGSPNPASRRERPKRRG